MPQQTIQRVTRITAFLLVIQLMIQIVFYQMLLLLCDAHQGSDMLWIIILPEPFISDFSCNRRGMQCLILQNILAFRDRLIR